MRGHGGGFPRTDPVILRARDIEDFHGILTRLIRDGRLRDEIGERTKAQIAAVNTGEGWKRELAKMYGKSCPRRATSTTLRSTQAHASIIWTAFCRWSSARPETKPRLKSRIAGNIETTVKAAPIFWRLAFWEATPCGGN